MFDTIKVWFFTVEVNLLLWLIALGAVLAAGAGEEVVWPVAAGFVFSALWQHRAFYHRKREREAARSNATSEVA